MRKRFMRKVRRLEFLVGLFMESVTDGEDGDLVSDLTDDLRPRSVEKLAERHL